MGRGSEPSTVPPDNAYVKRHTPHLVGWSLWWRWTLATALGELIGFAVPGSVAPVLAWALTGTEGAFPVYALFVAAVLAGVVEGASLGLAQWLVLRRCLRQVARWRWVLATAIAAGAAYILGMTPSTLTDLTPVSEPLLIGLYAVLGALLLPSIGLAQWLALRPHIPRAGWWIPANALAWLAGLAVPMVGLTSIPDGSPLAVWIIVGVISGALMGVMVGAITGVALVRLTTPRQSPPGSCR